MSSDLLQNWRTVFHTPYKAVPGVAKRLRYSIRSDMHSKMPGLASRLFIGVQSVEGPRESVLAQRRVEVAFIGGWRKKGEKAAATGKKPFTGNCFNCGKPGHRSFECKLPKKEQQAASSSGETTDLATLRAELKEIKERLSAVSVNEMKEGF
ncbi:transcription factor [Ganoderma sinense ZZ0214-1]|uniref:Transcription factor n=1 Tax=Ganoderma sinense ZZ0214-1 TaxID=1077348 RepID=A0A2G8RLW3_9APHY|nr:transcription factor [Ganoderma sinense ZZ0214-1]